MRRWRSWHAREALELMHAYIWCYQVPVAVSEVSVDQFASWLWLRSLRNLAIASGDWRRDFDRLIKRAVEWSYIDFNKPLSMPPMFQTLTDEMLSDIEGFFVPEAA